MQEKIKITKTDEQDGLEFFSINLSIDEIRYRELVEMYFDGTKEVKGQGSHSLTYSKAGISLTWNAHTIKVKGLNPYVVINDLRGLESPSASAAPTNEEDAKKELDLYGIEITFVDGTDTSSIITDMKE